MFLAPFRSDPFAAARQDAGLDPQGQVDREPRRRTAPAVVAALAVIVAVLATVTTPASGSDDEIASREVALRDATAARIEADQRVARVSARVEEVRTELERLGAADEVLTEELAQARREMREYAVAAYIDGGQTEIVRASLSPEKAVALSWQSNMAFGQSVSADDAADRFHTLREANSPARIEAAVELDRVSTELEEARFDAIQAAAHERDAESALAKARDAAARARAEQAAADRVAARARADRVQRTAANAPAPAQRQASTARVPQSAPSAGNPTPWESSTLAKIRRCESGGNYGAVSSSGRYRGAYQFDAGTWRGIGGSGDPAAASRAEQDHRALLLLRQRGTRPWPVCGR